MKKPIINIKPDRVRLTITLIYLAFFIISIISAFIIRKQLFAKNLLVMTSLIFFILFILSLLKLIRERTKKSLSQNFKELLLSLLQNIKELFSPLYRFLAKFISRFLPDYGDRIRIHGQDRRSFIFGSKNPLRKQRRLKNPQKWIDQENNRKRVRFIYTEYMIKKIKNGYFLKSNFTPKEISEIIAIDDEKTLFDIYQLVRYDNNVNISNDTLKSLMKYTKKAKMPPA